MEYPDRVTRGADGVYRWRCAIGKDYERQAYRLTLWVCGGFCLFFLGMALVMRVDAGALLATLLSCAAVMAIAGGVCLLFDRLQGSVVQPYELREDCIRSVSARSSSFSFRRVRKVMLRPDHIALKGRLAGPRIYVPQEDYDLVKGLILCRIPGDAEVVYENR